MSLRKPRLFLTASDDASALLEVARTQVPEIFEVAPANLPVADPEPGAAVAPFADWLRSTDLLIGVVTERSTSVYDYSAAEASRLAWEFDLARAAKLDVRLFRRLNMDESRINSEHAAFIEAAERAGLMATYVDDADLAVKIRAALNLWLVDYGHALLTHNTQTTRSHGAYLGFSAMSAVIVLTTLAIGALTPAAAGVILAALSIGNWAAQGA